MSRLSQSQHHPPPALIPLPFPEPALGCMQVCVECVGYLLEELRDPETLEAMRKDVENADIFIGSLIFIQVRRWDGRSDCVVWCGVVWCRRMWAWAAQFESRGEATYIPPCMEDMPAASTDD